MPLAELEISQKSAEQAGFPELAGVQIVNGRNPVEGALARKRLTPYQLTVHIMVNGVTTRQGIISKLMSLCGIKFAEAATGAGTATSGVIGKIVASVGIDEPTASANKFAAFNIGRGKYGITEYGKQLDALMSLDSGAADQTLAQKRADQSAARKERASAAAQAAAPALEITATARDIERVFNDPSTGLVAFKKIALNPAAPESILARLFQVYPHIVSKNPSWMLAKWSLNPEAIFREWTENENHKLSRLFYMGGMAGTLSKYLDVLPEDELELYFKTCVYEKYDLRSVLQGLPVEKLRLHVQISLGHIADKSEYWMSGHIGQACTAAGGWSAVSSDPVFIKAREAVQARLAELGKEWYISHIFWG